MSLRQLISDSSWGATVSVSPGVYSGPENCDLIVDRDVNLVAPSGAVLDCGLKSRCLSVLNAATVTVSGFTFKNGAAPNTTALTQRRKRPNENKNIVVHGPNFPDQPVLVKVVHIYATAAGIVEKHLPPQLRCEDEPPPTDTVENAPAIRAVKLQQGSSLGGCILVGEGSTAFFNGVSVSGCRAASGAGIGVVDSRVEITSSSFTSNGLSACSKSLNLTGGGGSFLNSEVTLRNVSCSRNFFSSCEDGDSDSMIVGTGFSFRKSNRVSITAPFFVTENSIKSSGVGRLLGAGLYFSNVSSITMLGPSIVVSGNSVLSQTAVAQHGGVFCFSLGLNLFFQRWDVC